MKTDRNAIEGKTCNPIFSQEVCGLTGIDNPGIIILYVPSVQNDTMVSRAIQSITRKAAFDIMFFKKPTGPVDFLIVGLGNPGKQYEFTRHNAGFLAVQELADRHRIKIDRIRFKSLCGQGEISGKKVLLMKPSTFMNNSGQAVVEAMQFYKIPIENVIVLYDDISLEPSYLRIRRKGSDGGHNGIKSIIYLTGKDTFPRIKIGVGKKPHPDYDLADWVLSHFTKSEFPLMEQAFKKSADAIELMVAGKIDQAMNSFN